MALQSFHGFCPDCMNKIDDPGIPCGHCGSGMDGQNPDYLLPKGTVLTDGSHTYLVGKMLGQGGFGATYIGADMDRAQRVAIKEYFPVRCAQRGPKGRIDPKPGQEKIYEGGRYSFLEEARMLASLEGMPSVVQGLVYFETNNTAYLVMEYLDGEPLYRMVEKSGRIPAQRLLPKLRLLMEDMAALHKRGVIHRDVSPDNIMWMDDGLKLMDFGNARSIEDGKSMEVVLKHGFAPVEQYQTRGQGPWTDVYALAATVYYCLTGEIPPAAPNRAEEDTLAPPRQLGADLTPEEETALMWGLAIPPKARPADMHAFSRQMFPEPEPKPVPAPGPVSVPVVGPPPAKLSLWKRFRKWLGL